MMPRLIEKALEGSLRKDPIADRIAIGNTVGVHVKVREGDKERVQVFTGIVIARKGRASTETFTVRRVSHGVGVERVFPVHSPQVVKVEVEKTGHVRRAKLYFLRRLGGRRARLRETGLGPEQAAETPAAAPEAGAAPAKA